MKKAKKLFEVPVSYLSLVTNYSVRDALMAIGLFILYCAVMIIMGLVNPYLSDFGKTILGGIINLCFVGVVLFLIVGKKQGVDTVGLKKGNVKLSLIMGVVLAAILFFCNCLSNVIFSGQTFIPLSMILLYICYYFTVALCEELIFRGYILSRLYGIVKNVYIDMLLSGVLFVLMHFPFRMAAYHMSFFELISNIPYMADLFITSLVLSFIRIKSDSLYGAVIPHWISDLSYSIVTHV